MKKPTKEQRERLKNVGKRPYLLGHDLTDGLVRLVVYTEELERENARFRKTLEFYANPETYTEEFFAERHSGERVGAKASAAPELK